jgi:curved DNA-binding protein CbpA
MKIYELLESMSRDEATQIFNRYGVKNTKALTPEQLKKLYLALVKKNHPDVRGGNQKSMQEINAAYDVLSKPEEKQKFISKPTSKWTPPKWSDFFKNDWEQFDRKKKEQDKNQEPAPIKHVDMFV